MRSRITTDLVLTLSTAALLLTLGACKKDESDPETIPVDTATAEEAEPTEETSTADTEDTATADEADAAATAAPTVVTTTQKVPPKGSSIDNCCAALRARSAVSGNARTKQALQMCVSIARLVKDGKTSRQAALTQIRSAAGGSVPGACR